MFWQNRNVLVTGSSGLLGGWVVAELKTRGAYVVGLERDRIGTPIHHGNGLRPDFIACGTIEDFELLVRVLNEYETPA